MGQCIIHKVYYPTLTGTATVSDVVSGKTFYNTNALSKLTGTYVPSPSASGIAGSGTFQSQHGGTVSWSCGVTVGSYYAVSIVTCKDSTASATMTNSVSGCTVLASRGGSCDYLGKVTLYIVKATSSSISMSAYRSANYGGGCYAVCKIM